MALSAKVGSFNTGTGAATTTVAVSGVGFQPKIVLFWWSGRTETVDTAGRGDHKRGFGYAASTTDRRRITTVSQDTPTTMVTNRSQDDVEAIAVSTTSDTIDGLLDLQSMDADGFTLVVDDQFTASYRIHYLALAGSDITDVAGGTFTKAAVTGNQDVTSLSFQPDCVIFMGAAQATISGAIAVDSKYSIGAAVSAAQQAVIASGSNDGAATSQTMSYCNDVDCIAFYNGGVSALSDRAQYVQSLSNGFQINWVTNAGGSEIILFVALKGGSYRVGSILTQTDTTTDIVASGFGFQPSAALLFSHGQAESADGTPTDDDEWSAGAFTSASERAACAVADDDNAGTAIVSTAIEHDEIYINLNANTGAVEGLMDIKSVDSDGFTAIMDDADPAQAFVWYLAVGATATPPAPATGGYMRTLSRLWGP